MSDDLETVFIEIDRKSTNLSKNILIGVVYRPPGGSINSFVEKISPILNSIKNEKKYCYLLGDFNINLLNADHHNPTSHFIDFMFSHEYFPLINRPTRVTHYTATLIDNIFTNNFDSSLSSIRCNFKSHI